MRAPLFALGASLLAVVAAFYLLHVQWLGFPDGALTAVDRAERGAFWVFGAIACALAVASFVTGSIGSSQARAFRVLMALTLVLILSAVAFDVGALLVLDDGAGG